MLLIHVKKRHAAEIVGHRGAVRAAEAEVNRQHSLKNLKPFSGVTETPVEHGEISQIVGMSRMIGSGRNFGFMDREVEILLGGVELPRRGEQQGALLQKIVPLRVVIGNQRVGLIERRTRRREISLGVALASRFKKRSGIRRRFGLRVGERDILPERHNGKAHGKRGEPISGPVHAPLLCLKKCGVLKATRPSN